jgi:hypothetical protein
MRVSVKMPPPTDEELAINDKMQDEYYNLIETCNKYKKIANPFDVIQNELLFRSLKFAQSYEDFYNFWLSFNKEKSL